MSKQKGLRKCTLISFCCTILLAVSISGEAQTDLPKIIQPSPEKAALFRFQDYPMDYSTGLPQINIPIYQVVSGSISVPISLSYHASGRKVYDQDGAVAIGWTLNAGGAVSRTIYGSPDFGSSIKGTFSFPNPFKLEADLNDNTLVNLQYLEKIFHLDGNKGDVGTMPYNDSEYDIFSYSMGDMGGKFIFQDVAGVKTPVMLPYKPYKIVPTYTTFGLTKIEITDDKGVLYEFGMNENYTTNDNVVSSLMLTKITSADKTDVVSFVYTANSEERKTISQQAVLIDAWNAAPGQQYPTTTLTYPEYPSHEIYQTARIKEIVFNQGKVVFNLVAGTDKINNIQILNLNAEVIKTIQLTRSQCNTMSDGLPPANKLDALIFKDKGGTAIETYGFEYYPVQSSTGIIDVRYCDWWGYYNNSGVHDFVPRYTNLEYIGSGGPGTIDVGNPAANRAPNLEAMKSGVLKKIIYPTGGSSEFIYENNKCTLNGAPGTPINGPGLRISQIKSADNNGVISFKTYKYGANESGYGAIELLPQMNAMSSQVTYNYISNYASGGSLTCYDPESLVFDYRERTFYSGFLPEISELANRPVLYTNVTEYHGDLVNNNGKTVYSYSTDYAVWDRQPMRVFEQSTIYKYHIYDYNYWNTPSLTQKTDYKRVNNIYKKVLETYYGSSITTTGYIYGLHVQRVHLYPQTGKECATNYYAEKYGTLINGVRVYTFKDYRIPVGYKNSTGTSEVRYNDDGSSIATGISYGYNSNNLISTKTTTSSKNETILSTIKYPFDYTGNALLTQMVTLNMLNYPVEQIETKAGISTKSVRTNYYNFGTTPAHIYPQTTEVKIGNNLYETRLRYSAYDTDGNPVTVAKENDHSISYIWGYNNTYPIAEVINSPVKNIFHTSFEDGTGNSTLNDARTGHYSKTGGYSKSLTSLDNGAYTLSYWQKSGGIWSLQTSAVTVSTGTYTISLTGQVDEIRFYPALAQMKTLTYDPLVGITSECDASDRIIYYEYDNYGRLKLVKDFNGHILKTFKYQYQGTSAN